jgi:biopolymer transport protein ExbB
MKRACHDLVPHHPVRPLLLFRTRRRLAAFLSLLVLLLFATPFASLAQDRTPLADPEATLRQMAGEIQSDTRLAREEFTARKQEIQGRLAQLRAQVQQREQQLERQKARFEELGRQEDKARQALARQEQDLTRIENAALNAARDAEGLLLTSLGGAQDPSRVQTCRRLLDSEGLPSFAAIEDLTRTLLRQIRDSGVVQLAPAQVLGLDGSASTTPVLRLGESAAFCRHEGQVRGLTLLEGGRFSVSAADLSGPVRQAAQAALDQFEASAFPDNKAMDSIESQDIARNAIQSLRPQDLALDLSQGVWFSKEARRNSLTEKLASGGFLVWPILLVGLAGLLIGLERLVLLLRVRRASDATLTRLEELLRAGKHEQCRALCRNSGDSPACRVMDAGLDHAGAPRDVLENVFHDAILKEVPRLERFLPTLAVLGAVAPLLGLLGTVTGMINTFGMMTLFGNSDPKLMSGGISEALITTQLGLGVAIPILLLHHFLERRVDRIVGDMEEKSVAFSVTLLHPEQRP